MHEFDEIHDIASIKEYASSKLLVGLERDENNLYDVNLETSVIKKIITPNISNQLLTSIQCIGEMFDINGFPYLIATGNAAALLVNIRTGQAQTLMTTVQKVRDARHAFQFLKHKESIN